MKILVLNRGSSSIKCSVYELHARPSHPIAPAWEAHLDSIDLKNLKAIPKEIDAIGHRIVHGGKMYQKSVQIDGEVKRAIKKFADIAPLHNKADLEGIETLEKLFPNKPQIAVFDTSFHATLPLSASVYPGPYEWYEEGIQKYGFHGISFQYCTRRVQELFGQMGKILICHLGSGASLCAVKEGKSIDTTMGFTPLDGLMMDTRSGSIDPGILLYLLEKKKETPASLSKVLNERSGLLGLSGLSADMREILASEEPRAKLALEVYLHRLVSSIGSLTAILGGLDALVFTAGIGENSPLIRKRVCESLNFLGIHLDPQANREVSAKDRDLSLSGSKTKVLLVHTQEAFEIARECWQTLTTC